MISNFTKFNWSKLFSVAILAAIFALIIFAPSLAHADNPNSIHNSLIAGGGGQYEGTVITGWKICLGLANIFVALILVFIAVVNIAHIQYDTYNLRKTLPWLIIGIILANFSLLICRMFVDVAQILTDTFTGGNVIVNVIEPLYSNLGLYYLGGIGATASIVSLALSGGTLTIALGILTLILLLLPFIGLFILLFLLYIRLALILILAIIAPLAFVMLAFPVTQGFFKQWWSWFMKWVFMKPISFFLLWAAANLGTHPTSGVTIVSFLITLALCYLALIAPFKLGGAVMGGWSKLGQYLSGTRKGGYIRKPVEDNFGKARKAAGLGVGNWFYQKTGLGKWMGTNAAGLDELIKTQEKDREGIQRNARQRMPAGQRSRLELRQAEAQALVDEDEASIQENINRMESGEVLPGLTEADYRRITGQSSAHDAASRFVDLKGRIMTAQLSVKKRRELDVVFKSLGNLVDNNNVRAAMKNQLKKAEDAGTFQNYIDGIETDIHDSEGVARAKKNVTPADLVDSAADYRAKAKVAHGNQRNRFYEIAREKEEQYARFRELNPDTYDYQAILDRNISGRQHSVVAPFVVDERQTDYLNTTGFNVLDGTRKKNGQLSVFGTAEVRGTDEDFDRWIRGERDQNEPLANLACIIKRDSALQHVQDAFRGDQGGVYALGDMLDRVQEARVGFKDDDGVDFSNWKVDTISKALARMPQEQYRELIKKLILDQYNAKRGTNLPDFATLSASPDALNDALRNFDLSVLTPGRGQAGQAHGSFIQLTVGEVMRDKHLGFGSTPGIPASQVSPQGDPHPISSPSPRGGGTPPPLGGGGGPSGGGPGGPGGGPASAPGGGAPGGGGPTGGGGGGSAGGGSAGGTSSTASNRTINYGVEVVVNNDGQPFGGILLLRITNVAGGAPVNWQIPIRNIGRGTFRIPLMVLPGESDIKSYSGTASIPGKPPQNISFTLRPDENARLNLDF